MRNLIRNPLTWMVVAELVVVTALVALAWSAIAQPARPAVASSALDGGGPVGQDAASPIPSLPGVGKPGSNPAPPGLNVDPAFWLNRLQGLNRDQVYFEQLEWRLVHTAMDAARRYLETVVLPSVQRAERAAGAPGAAGPVS
jgi:hypothetical protein